MWRWAATGFGRRVGFQAASGGAVRTRVFCFVYASKWDPVDFPSFGTSAALRGRPRTTSENSSLGDCRELCMEDLVCTQQIRDVNAECYRPKSEGVNLGQQNVGRPQPSWHGTFGELVPTAVALNRSEGLLVRARRGRQTHRNCVPNETKL